MKRASDAPPQHRIRRCRRALTVAALAAALPAGAQAWRLTGPTGGDVRSLAVSSREPAVVYLGTAEGVLYRSGDAGQSWRRLEPGFPLRGMSLDNIVVTPAGDLIVGYWRVAGDGGGVARSADGGTSFRVLDGIAGESVRALALAPSDPARIVAGTLTGIFGSDDGGTNWRRLSPAGHLEIRNVESVAVDPLDRDVIYAGTWHLPWKTLDGGRGWRPINAGMIDDSDVFTMTVDLRTPKNVFATACTGIYRSANGGASWSKFRGIPPSSRRTRAFAQDPEQPDTLYAGTTEGLWVSDDAGASWSLRTSKDLVINAVETLRGGVVLLGTDGAGVLRSADRARSFSAANDGFSSRLVTQLLRDGAARRLIAVVQNDRFHSGVLVAPRAEGPWAKLAPGLEGREVASLAASGSDLFAGTDDGIFVYRAGAAAWQRLATRLGGTDPRPRVAELLAPAPGLIVAATNLGLLRSADRGLSWQLVSLGSARVVVALAPLEGALLAATALGIYRSDDGAASFQLLSSGPDAKVLKLEALPTDERLVFATTAAGLYKSRDGGRRWYRCYGGLPVSEITGLALHPNGRTVFAADFARGGLFRSDDRGESWRSLDTDGLMPDRVWAVAIDPAQPDVLLAATASGGLHALAGEPAASH